MKTLLKSGLSLLILFAVVAPSLKAQKAKAEQVSYTYFRKALVATEEAKRTYSVEVNIPFAATYNADMAKYNEDEGRARRIRN